MKKKTVKLLALTGIVMFAMGSLAGRGNSVDNSPVIEKNVGTGMGSEVDRGSVGNSSTQKSQTTELSGSILMVGSTSMETFVSALAERYMELHQNVTVTAECVGSGAGIEAVLWGIADIGNSSRNLKTQEKADGAVENIVAIDGIAVCVDPANKVGGLTRQQLIDIYTGAVTNWSEVGGENAPIVVVGREAGSGTRGAFEEVLGIENECAYANVLDSTGAVMAKVASIHGAIGYVSLDAADDTVLVLQLDGVEPTAENIKAGRYSLSSPFVMVTLGEISEQSELVQDWFAFVFGEEGQDIAASIGLIIVE